MDGFYPLHPMVGVSAIVWRGDRLLLVQRKFDPGAGRWSLPGGKLHLGESLAEGAAREVAEETGITARIIEPVLIYDVHHRDPDGRIAWHYVLIPHSAEWVAGEPAAADDAADCGWFTVEQAFAKDLWAEIRDAITRSAAARQARGG